MTAGVDSQPQTFNSKYFFSLFVGYHVEEPWPLNTQYYPKAFIELAHNLMFTLVMKIQKQLQR